MIISQPPSSHSSSSFSSFMVKSSFLCSGNIINDDEILINLLDEKYMKSHNMVGVFIPFSSHISSHQNKKNDCFISLSTISPTFSSSSHVNWMDLSSHLNLPPSHDHLSHNLTSHNLQSSQLSFSPSERSTIYPFLLSSYPTMDSS